MKTKPFKLKYLSGAEAKLSGAFHFLRFRKDARVKKLRYSGRLIIKSGYNDFYPNQYHVPIFIDKIPWIPFEKMTMDAHFNLMEKVLFYDKNGILIPNKVEIYFFNNINLRLKLENNITSPHFFKHTPNKKMGYSLSYFPFKG